MDVYDVKWNNNTVGNAEVTVQGLYTCFHCVCSLPQTDIFRLRLVCGGKSVDLGIFVPVNGKYIVNKRISTKQLEPGSMVFEIIPTQNQPEEFVISLIDGQQFPYISRLAHARLVTSGGVLGIVISDQSG